jgi:hypothetical protein
MPVTRSLAKVAEPYPMAVDRRIAAHRRASIRGSTPLDRRSGDELPILARLPILAVPTYRKLMGAHQRKLSD